MVIVLRFNDRDGKVGFIEEEVVSPLFLAPGDHLAAHNDSAVGEGIFTAPLVSFPARLHNGWRNETVTNVGFAEVFLIHIDSPLVIRPTKITFWVSHA